MRARICCLISASMMVANCGPGAADGDSGNARETGTFGFDPESGETFASIDTGDGIATMRSGENVPAVLPVGFSVFPDANVINSTQVVRGEGENAVRVVLIVMESTASPAQMAEFYRRQAAAAGIAPELELATESGHMIAGRALGGSSFSFNAIREGGVTDAQLMVNVWLD